MLSIIPNNWSIKALNEIAKIKGGKRVPKGEKLVFEDTGFPYIRVTDFNDVGTIDLDDLRYITKEVFEQIKSYTISEDDLYISIAGTIGKAGIIPKELSGANLTENACKLVFDNSVFNKYVYYFTQTECFLEQAGLNTRVAAMPKLALSRLGTIILPIPVISEQKRIVAILDQAFSDIDQARATAETNLKNARELFDSYLQQVFSQRSEGWKQEKMSEVCDGKITDGTHQTPKYFDDGYIFLSSKNVTSGVIDWDNVKYLDESQHIEMQKRLSPRLNDILLAKNGTTGVAAIVDREEIFNIYVSLALLRPSKKIEPRYLLHFVNSAHAKEQFNQRLKGVGVPNLHLNEIREVIVTYPECRKKQQEIVNRIDTLLSYRVSLEDIYQNKLNAINELKKSILQKAFTGELTKGKGIAA